MTDGMTVALETYAIAAVISFVVAGIIVVIRNLLSGKSKSETH
jgi:hypothetical protein